MGRLVDIFGVGEMEFPDDMSEDEITWAVNTEILPNADMANPNPEAVRARPDLFPDIDRGSFFGGLGSGAERLSRAPEAVGAGVFRSPEELADLKAQMAEEDRNQRYRASLDDVTGQWDKGNYLQAAGTLFGDVLPQTLGESIPDMGIIGSGALAGAAVAAPIPIPGARVAGAIIGGAVAGLPTFFGMNVERQIRENDITDPDKIETMKATGAAALQGGLEGLILPVLGLIPGVSNLGGRALSRIVQGGVEKLGKPGGAKLIGKYALKGGATEAITEVGQQALERAQAGLDISPTDASALKEYIEAAVLGGLLGVGFGGLAGGYQAKAMQNKIDKNYESLSEDYVKDYTYRMRGLEHMAIEAGAIPNPDIEAPLLLAPPTRGAALEPEQAAGAVADARERETQLKKTEDRIEGKKARLRNRVDAAVEKVDRRKTPMEGQELFDHVENLWSPNPEYTLAEVAEVAPEAVEILAASAPEQETFTQSEIEGATENTLPGLAKDLQVARLAKDEVFAEEPNIQPEEIEAIAEEKNVKIGGASFDALVYHISGAENLKEATPRQRSLVKDTLAKTRRAPRAYDPIPMREEKYSQDQFNTAMDMIRNHASMVFEPSKIGKATGLNNAVVKDMRQDMLESGFLRKEKKGGIHRADQMRQVKKPKGKGKKWVNILDKDFLLDVPKPPSEPQQRGMPDEGKPTNKKYPERHADRISYELIERPRGSWMIVAVGESTRPNGDIVETGRRPIDTFTPKVREGATQEEIDAANEEQAALAKVTLNRLNNRPVDTRADTLREFPTDAELRAESATPQEYADYVKRKTAQPPKPSPTLDRIQAALKDTHQRRGLAQAGVPIKLVDSVLAALDSKSVIPEGGVSEGAFENGIIYLGLDIAARRIDPNATTEANEAAVLQHLADVLSHEQIHALIAKGILGPTDFKILARFADTHNRPVEYRQFSKGRTKWTYLDDVRQSHQGILTTDEAFQEEAIAEMFRDWTRDPSSITGKPASIFRRIVKFFLTLGNFFRHNGVRSVNDIFGEIERGELQGGVDRQPLSSTHVDFSIAEGGKSKALKYPVIIYKGVTFRGEPGEVHGAIRNRLHEDGTLPWNYESRFLKEGFQLTKEWGGGFVDRIEAVGIALEAGQVKPEYQGVFDYPDVPLVSTVVQFSAAPPPADPKVSVAAEVEDMFEAAGEEGARMEYPGVGSRLDRYIHEGDQDALETAYGDTDYPMYLNTIQGLLNRVFPTGTIPVTRIQGYSNVAAAERPRQSFTAAVDDVAFIGNLEEAELILSTRDGFQSVRLDTKAKWSVAPGLEGDGIVGSTNEPKFSVGARLELNLGFGAQMGNNDITLVERGGGQRATPGTHSMEYAIYDMPVLNETDDMKAAEAGIVRVNHWINEEGTEITDEIEGLVNIKVPKAKRKSGIGKRVLEALLANSRDGLHIYDIQKSAKKYWEARGAVDIHTNKDGFVDGFIPKEEGKFSIAPPRQKRYAARVRRVGKSTITRYFFARNDVEARALAARSPAINRAGFDVQVELDDPSMVEDANSPRYSIRKHQRILKPEQYYEATQFVPLRPEQIREGWGEFTRAMVTLGGKELPVVLHKGIQTNSNTGFGLAHMVAGITEKRFGTKFIMAKKLKDMLANSDTNKIVKYSPPQAVDVNNNDYRMYWTDPSDNSYYALGLERHKQDGKEYAAITTFFPDIIEIDKPLTGGAGRKASTADIMAYQIQRDAKIKHSVVWESKYTIPENAISVPDVYQTKNGKWNGGPTGRPMSQRQVTNLVNKLTKHGLSRRAVHEASRDWYENAGHVLRKLTQDNPKTLEDMLRIVAYLSADNALGGNISGAIDMAFDIAANGKVTVGKGRYPNVAIERIQPILEAEQFDKRLEGVSDKVMSFYRNMRDPAYDTQDFSGEVTLDKWMFRAFGYRSKSYRFSGQQYGFGKMVMEQVATKMTEALGVPILPRHAQAMIWTAQRNLSVEPVDATMVGFEHYFDRHAAVITWEADPSARSDWIPGLSDQPMAVQREFSRQARELITADGQDLILQKIGAQPLAASMPGTGTYEGSVSPNITTHLILPKSGDKVYDSAAADLYTNLVGYIFNQKAVPWHRADPTLNSKNSNIGVAILIEKESHTSFDLDSFYKHMRTYAPSSEFSVIPRLDGKTEVRFINFPIEQVDGTFNVMPEKDYRANILTAIDLYDSDAFAEINDFRSVGAYLESGENNEGYRQRISASGRPDLLNWASGRRKAFYKHTQEWKERIATIDAGHSGPDTRERTEEPVEELQAPRVDPDGTIPLTHWSNKPKIKNILPHRYGTGILGAEDRRRRTYPKEWVDRSYFGVNVDEKGGYAKEIALGDERYTAKIPYSKVYDWGKDPLNFHSKAREKWGADNGGVITEAEKLISEAGYTGYWTVGQQGLTLASFKKIPVQHVETETDKDAAKLSVTWDTGSMDDSDRAWASNAERLVDDPDFNARILTNYKLRHAEDLRTAIGPYPTDQTDDFVRDANKIIALSREKDEWETQADNWVLTNFGKEFDEEVVDAAMTEAESQYFADPDYTWTGYITVNNEKNIFEIRGKPDSELGFTVLHEGAEGINQILDESEGYDLAGAKQFVEFYISENIRLPEEINAYSAWLHPPEVDAETIKVAPPVNTQAFSAYRKNAAPQATRADGNPRVFWHSTDRDGFAAFDFTKDPKSTAIFISETPQFAHHWITSMLNPTPETPGKSIPLYLGAEKLWDFREQEDLDAAENWRQGANLKPSWSRFDAKSGLARGDWRYIEDEAFVEGFLKANGYHGFSVKEYASRPTSKTNPINWGIFRREDLKSIFNEDFDRSDPAFSIVMEHPNRPENGIHERLTEKNNVIWKRALKMLKKELAPGGLLFNEAFEFKVERDSEMQVVELDAHRLVKWFERAVKKATGKRWNNIPQPLKEKISAVLHGEEGVDLPVPIREAIYGMRGYIDKLSGDYVNILQREIQAFREEGSNPEAQERANLLEIISNNIGKYVHRSYKAYDDPNWYKKIPEDVTLAAYNYLVKGYQAQGHADPALAAEQMLDILVKEGTAYDNLESFIKEHTLGAKDLSVLRKRKDISPEIRALLGEHVDPRFNFVSTATKMGRLIFNQKFLDKVAEVGLRDGLFYKDGTQPPGHQAQMAGLGSNILSPLNGLRTTPELKQAFEDALNKSNYHVVLRNVIAWNGAVKYGKTILSPTTQARNFMSAYLFTVANGHWDMSHMKLAGQTMWDYIGSLDGEFLDYHRELVRAGVLYNNPHAGALMDLLKESKDSQFLNQAFSRKSNAHSMMRLFGEYAQKFYMAGDDFWKIIGFENELRYIMDHKNMTREQATPIAARRIRDTYPTYSMTGSFMQKLRRFPLAGTFVSFPSEILRTRWNMLKYIRQDLKDPDMRGLAKKRIAGFAITSAWTYAIGGITAYSMGLTDDEEEALRKMGSPWAENAQFFFTGRDEKGNIKMIDMSFLDPYNILARPLTAMLRDQPVEKAFMGAVTDVLAPFFGPDISFSALYEVITNKKIGGGSIYNPDKGVFNQTMEITNHIRKNIQPGVASWGERMIKAIRGQKSPSGRVYDVGAEAAAFVGFRISTFDPKLSLYYRTFEFGDRLSNARNILSQVAKDPNPVTKDELVDAFYDANRARVEAYDDMYKFIIAAKHAGMTDSAIRRVLSASGVSKKYINSFVKDKPPPRWRIGRTFLKGATKRAKLLIDRETAQELKRRRRFVRRVAREKQN